MATFNCDWLSVGLALSSAKRLRQYACQPHGQDVCATLQLLPCFRSVSNAARADVSTNGLGCKIFVRSCNKPLFAIVDLAAASRTLTRETLLAREKSLWRYREVSAVATRC